MNEPLKHKLFSVYGQILNRKTLLEAWKHVKANKGAGGVDKVSIQEFEKNLDENIEALLISLREKTYKPSTVRRVYIPKKNGKLRPLGIPTIRDRIVQQALTDRLSPFFEANVFHDNSCGFRPGRDAELAIKKILSRLVQNPEKRNGGSAPTACRSALTERSFKAVGSAYSFH